jgi:vancomycin permeability regulator SanA
VRGSSLLGMVLRRLALVTVAAGALTMLVALALRVWVEVQADGKIYQINDRSIPNHHVALVFGAGLNGEGRPSKMLYDRVATAVDLYNNNKVDKLLMTGDNGTPDYNEVEAMRQTAVELGVPDEDIVLDYAGFNTWDSCYRAREVFSLTEATLVTQRFHLPRALYACNHLGVRSVGVVADRSEYSTFYNETRELLALLGTGVRILINDQPRFLGPKVNVDQPQRAEDGAP